MKQTRFIQPNRLFSSIRFAIAVSLVTAAVAMAFVAVKPSVPRYWVKSDNKDAINKFRQDSRSVF